VGQGQAAGDEHALEVVEELGGFFGELGVRWLHTGGIFAALSDASAEVAKGAVDLGKLQDEAEKKAAATSEDPAEPQPGEAPSESAEDKPARRTRRRATAKSAAPSPENSSDTPEESA